MDAAPRRKFPVVVEVFLAFLGQGLTAFGGPVAHLGYFRREFVEGRAWLSDAAFADLVSLCHFLPGPASSQVGMAIGMRRAGLAGGLAAWIGFTLPAAAAMIALAIFQPALTRTLGSGWLHGLSVAAAAIVLQAVIALARTLAVGPIRAGMAIGATAGLLIAHGPVAQVLAIVAGALFGVALLREPVSADDAEIAIAAPSRRIGAGALIAFGVILAALPLLAGLLANPALGLASVFYRAGALVFGGGHVVLPLLDTEVVGRGWLDSETFLAGYGAMQALPGPLFAFAGFVGAAQTGGPGGVVGGLIALIAIFLPGALLMTGVLPFWDRLRTQPAVRAASAGAAAVVVGLLAAALWNPVLSTAVQRPSDWALVAAAYVFLTLAKLPPWVVVIGFAAATGIFMS